MSIAPALLSGENNAAASIAGVSRSGEHKGSAFMEKIADTADSYRYLNTDMKFSSVLLRRDGLTKHTYRAKGKFMALSNLQKHIKKHINVAVSSCPEIS